MICKRCGNETEDEYFFCDECFSKKNDAKTKIKIGIGMSIVGVAASIASYFNSLASGGDHYYYFTGLFLLGLFIFGSGLSGVKEFNDIENGKEVSIEPNKDEIDALFCNVELSQLSNGSGTPWDLFSMANYDLNNGERQKAIEILTTITKLEGLESRHYLQAWYFLRKLDIFPEESIRYKVYGVIIEVCFNEGTNIIAAYSDYSARFFSYNGSAVIWDHPNDLLDETIDALILASQRAVNQINYRDGERPMPPIKGITRVIILTPFGLYFKEGPFTLLSKDLFGGEVITVGYKLMQMLLKIDKNYACQ